MEGLRRGERRPYNPTVNRFHWVSSSEDDVSKMTTLRLSSRKNKKFSRGFRGVSALEPEVTESAEFYAVSDEIRRWSSFSEDECQWFVWPSLSPSAGQAVTLHYSGLLDLSLQVR